MTHPVPFLAPILAVVGMLSASDATAADGYFDTSFPGGSGLGHFAFGGNYYSPSFSYAHSAALENNGALFLAGDSAGGWWVGEMFGDGQWVPTFGNSDGSGRITNCLLDAACASEGLVVARPLPNGQYLALSVFSLHLLNAGAHSLVSKLPLPITVNDSGGSVTPRSLAVLADGKILAVGFGKFVGISTADGFGVVRLTSALQLDPTFNAVTVGGVTFAGGAVVTVDAAETSEGAYQVLVQSDGRILLIGYGSGGNFEVVRLNVDGSPDSTFGTNGAIKVAYGAYLVGNAIFDAYGRIIVALWAHNDAANSIIVRVADDGHTIEAITQPPITGCNTASIYGLALDSAGRVLGAGRCVDGANKTHFLVLRARTNNAIPSLDASFGLAGVTLGWFDSSTDFSTSLAASAYAMTLDSGGRPIIAGGEDVSPLYAGIARLTYDLIYTDRFEPPAGCLPPDCN